MIKIGLVGEDPNDTESIKNLFAPSFKGKAQFIKLLKNYKGNDLDTKKFENNLPIELKTKKPDVVVFIRDADGIRTETKEIEKRKRWYLKLSKGIDTPHLLLINIYELEALIFADVKPFNKRYNALVKGGRDVIAELRLETVEANCDYFNAFTAELKTLIEK